MPLDVAVQMDHIAGIRIAGDSTFALLLEAQARGHRLWHYTADRLAMEDGRVFAAVEPLEVRDVAGDHFTLGPKERVDLARFDVIHMRQDPPFDMHYVTATHLLERVHPKTLVVNDPAHVRNAPEKVFVTEFPDLMPPTLISRDPDEIRRFRQVYGDVVMKPLYGNGGAAVFRVKAEDENFGSLMDMFSTTFREPWVTQQYRAEVRDGDKRIILVDGEPVGAINRVPAEGEARSNMHVGGRPEPVGLTAREHEICAIIGPVLRDKGLIFTGIDVIDGWLTEINVTSPTGIQELERFDGINAAALIWQAVERRMAARNPA